MAKAPPPLSLNGYTPLPAGKIAAVVTYLHMRSPPAAGAEAGLAGWSFDWIGTDLGRYRALFRAVGEPWLWFSRLVMPDRTLAAILADPQVEAYALQDGGDDVGFLELDFREPGRCKLAFLGVVPRMIGRGAGRALMGVATQRAFARPLQGLFVHTCTLDHPGALGFYIRSGFTPYRRAIEVADDPRLMGYVPLETAPHCPILV
jgi:GNAT superfamily N-acetyltransferase